ncbi:hypothetical protein LCGC14_2770460, partial [marine sediment metagenome]
MPSLKSYSQTVSKEQSKPVQKFSYEMLYGLLTRGSVRLSQIARSLKEDTALLYTEKRLSRNICGNIDTEKLEREYLKLVKVGEVIAVDNCDIEKNKGYKMPYRGIIWDGSEQRLASGYNMIQIEAVNKDRSGFPLAMRLHSYKAYKEGESQNKLLLREVERLSALFPNRIWVFDRGYDAGRIMEGLRTMPLTYVIRQKGTRKLFLKDKSFLVKNAWRYIPLKERGRQRIGFAHVRINGTDRVHTIILAKRKGRPIVALLSNYTAKDMKDAERLLDAYKQRWGIEESIRFLKQSFDLEDI